MPPLIYIAALRRTGSKVISEALTVLPQSVVLREPGTSGGRFKIRPDRLARLVEAGVPETWLRQLSDRYDSPAQLGTALAKDILPTLGRTFAHLGIKEIRNEHWREVVGALDARFVLTARDPRDIYLSLADQQIKRVAMGKRKTPTMPGGVTPATVSDYVIQQFRYQREMDAEREAVKVRYEDLCAEPRQVLAQVRAFCEMPLADQTPELSSKHSSDQGIRGDRIVSDRLARWRTEPDPQRLAEAQETFERLTDYVGFWGYTVQGFS